MAQLIFRPIEGSVIVDLVEGSNVVLEEGNIVIILAKNNNDVLAEANLIVFPVEYDLIVLNFVNDNLVVLLAESTIFGDLTEYGIVAPVDGGSDVILEEVYLVVILAENNHEIPVDSNLVTIQADGDLIVVSPAEKYLGVRPADGGVAVAPAEGGPCCHPGGG